MSDAYLYNILSLVAAATAVFSALVALKAMRRGLTNEAMFGMAVVLAFVAIGRVWHTTREILQLKDWAELVEYLIYIVGNSAYFTLALRTRKPLGPDVKLPGQPTDIR